MSDTRDVAVPVRQSVGLLQQVIEAARNPEIDAAKMETLARLVNSQQDREREIEFNQSKNAAIMEMPVITKDGRIIIRKAGEREREQGRFAKWEDIDRVIRPILQKYNLALSFDMAERQGGGITVTPILSHTNGYTQRGGGFPVPPETSGSKNAAQAMGSSASYGKRYAGCAMLNIVTEGVDDDGNMGRGTSVSLPYEREQLVLREAEEAYKAGRYVEWYQQQSPKDRAYLVGSGKHEEYGGKALPKPEPEPTPTARREPVRPDPEPESEPDPPQQQRKPPTTAREWVDAFKSDVGKCQTADFLDEFVDSRRPALTRLQQSDPELWEDTQTAIRERREAIEEGRLV